MSRSLAIFAINFDEPTPADAVNPPVTSAILVLIRAATSRACASSVTGSSEAARSRNASSRESGSISGVNSWSAAMMSALACR